MAFLNFEEIFSETLRSAPIGSWIQRLHFLYQAETSYLIDISNLQNSFCFRSRYLGWVIAQLLIDEKGDLQRNILSELSRFWDRALFCLGPKREGDALIHAHLLSCLSALESDPQVWSLIRKFSLPLCHKRAEQVIRETLWPLRVDKIESFHVRRAAMSAWLTLLTQTIGSCFATAPAILIQKQPFLFFKDLYDLLSKGQLKRVLDGKEYAVPLSPSSGKMDLEKSFVSKESIFFSPGLIQALEVVHLLPSHLSLGSKIEQFRKAIANFPNAKTPSTLLQALILNSLGLSEEDVKEEELLAKNQMTPLLTKSGAVYYQPPTVRAQKVAEWKKLCIKADMAFQCLTECSLLRSWEYTVASFCDMKVDFAKWNLYLGLGLQTEQKGGIAEFLYRKIDSYLQLCNEKIAKHHQEYEAAASQVYALESLLHRSANDAQYYQLKGQLTGAIHHMQIALEIRDQSIARAQGLSEFFSFLINFYIQKLAVYFQEVFDVSVSGLPTEIFEDSPAGFRLLYKHGRADASLWTLIYTAEEYIHSLSLFFSAVENEMIPPASLEASFISETTTELIQFIQNPEFLKGSIARSQAYGKTSPWAYISGGTLQTLVQSYIGRDLPFTEISFLPRSEEDLLIFLLELKKEYKGSFLIHSPNHAFILHLDMLSEKAIEWIKKGHNILEKWKLNEEKKEYLAHLFSERIAEEKRALFLHQFRQRTIGETQAELRSHFFDSLRNIEGFPPSGIDSFLYEHMPVLEKSEIQEALNSLLASLGEKHSLSFAKTAHSIEIQERLFMSSAELIQTTKAILLQIVGESFSSVDWDQEIVTVARSLHLCYPYLLLFGDTNWPQWFFGFVFNSSTDRLELWRLSRTGLQGAPMNEWKEWFSFGNHIPWVILSRPEEYNQLFPV